MFLIDESVEASTHDSLRDKCLVADRLVSFADYDYQPVSSFSILSGKSIVL